MHPRPATDTHPPGAAGLRRLAEAAWQREEAGLRRTLRPRTPDHDGLLDLASNDYLGLSRDPRLIEASTSATHRWGAGSTGSRLVTGTTTLHAELERALAAFVGAPAALVFSSGYLANLAAVAALSGPGTLVVSDAGNHASIIDACRLSRARVAVTPRRAVGAVERALAERDEEVALVVTDTVFSVDGDLAPLAALHEVVRRHGAILVADEAHALGVVGPGGRGAVYDAGLISAPDVVVTATLSKSLGAQGGAVVGAPEVVETLIDTGRPFIFDTGIAPACVGAALAALEILADDPELAERARTRADQIADIIRGRGLETANPGAAVVPAFLDSPQAAVQASRRCAEHGVRVGCFRPPSVPPGRSCLRLTARADLTGDDLDLVARTFGAVV